LKKRLKEALSDVLPPAALACVYNSYDIVGDIAIIRLTEASEEYRRNIAEALLATHKNVKTILAQTGPVHGDFRIRKLDHVAGKNRTVTTHTEAGCKFRVDLEECYFSPRLSYERMRIAKLVKDGEVVVNMFAGAGCFSLVLARHSKASRIYSVDINPIAIQLMQENIRVNGAYGRVIPLLGDAKEIIEKGLCGVADHVLMLLPERALEYLPYALSALKRAGGWIHYYDFEHAAKNENPIEKVEAKVVRRLESLGVSFKIPYGRVVRSTGPYWYQVVIDIETNLHRNRNDENVDNANINAGFSAS
jgi:tRNA (guanine37-N1)-methyltransferase